MLLKYVSIPIPYISGPWARITTVMNRVRVQDEEPP